MSGWFDYSGYDQPNWGGYDENPIPPEVVTLAKALYDLLNSDRPHDAPGGDGSIGFEWRHGEDMLCLDVEDGGFRMYGSIGGKHYRTVVKPEPEVSVSNGVRQMNGGTEA